MEATWNLFILRVKSVKKNAARVLRFVEALSADEGGFAIAIHAAVVISDE